MNDKRIPFVRHALVYGAGTLSLQAAGIVLIPLYTHYLSPEEYGVLQLIYRIGAVFHICLMIQAIKLAAFNLVGVPKARTNAAGSPPA